MVVSKAALFMKEESDPVAGWKTPRSWEPSAGVEVSRAEQEVSPVQVELSGDPGLPLQVLHHSHTIPSVWTGWVKDGLRFSPKTPPQALQWLPGSQPRFTTSRFCCELLEALTHLTLGITGICHSGAFRTSSFWDFWSALCPPREWGEILAAHYQWLFPCNLRICSICE